MDHLEQTSIARSNLRAVLLERREGIAVAERRIHDAGLVERLHRAAPLAQAGCIAVYAPIRSEPDLAALYRRWWQEGRQLALPIVTGRAQPLLFARYAPDTELVEQRFGVRVPRLVEAIAPDALIMPCVGFRVTKLGLWRLGYGAGFYDRTLAARPVPAVGVAYDEAETDAWEPAGYDAPLVAIATPSRWITSIASP